MGLLLEFADYSLRGLKKVPEQKACTSVARQWEITSNKDFSKAPVIETTIKKQEDKQGINSTLMIQEYIYVDNERFIQKVKKIKLQMMKELASVIGFHMKQWNM